MKNDLLMLKRVCIVLICFGLLASCSNSKPEAKENRKDDIAATKKQVKALCKKVDLDVFKLSRAVDYDANLEQLKKNYNDTQKHLQKFKGQPHQSSKKRDDDEVGRASMIKNKK